MTTTFLDGARRAAGQLRHPTGALIALTAIAVAIILVFAFTDLPGKWEYALGLRTRTIAGMVIAAAAVGAATVLFQTITANRILTPGIMGFDAVFLAIQTVVAFAIGPALLVAAPPLASWTVELVLMTGSIVLLYWWLFVRRRFDLHVIVLAGLVLGVLFRSVTAFLQRLLDPKAYGIHVPLGPRELRAAHGRAGLDVERCGYLMPANWRVVVVPPTGRGRRLERRALGAATKLVWAADRLGARIPPNRLTSPYAACVARLGRSRDG